ncbi:MAG: glycosyltransferase family 4 protein [Phycisphaerae bacterium]
MAPALQSSTPPAAEQPLDLVLWVEPLMLAGEGALIRHLVSGLIADGHHIRYLAPQGCDLSSLPTLNTETLTYTLRPWERFPAALRWRLRDIIETLRDDPPDLLLAWGNADHVPLGQLAQMTQLPLMVWVWDAAELFAPLAALPGVRTVLTASEAIRARTSAHYPVPVEVLRPGVFTVPTPACFDVLGQVPCLVSLDPLASLEAYTAVLEACEVMVRQEREFLLFAYDTGLKEHPIWQLAAKKNLLNHISFVPYQQDAELLMLHGDIYLHALPGTRVLYRSLEAMAHGLAVVGAENHAADHLIEGQTWRRIGQLDGATWANCLTFLLDHRDQALAQARAGQAYIHAHHSMAAMLERFVGLARHAAGMPLRMAPQ